LAKKIIFIPRKKLMKTPVSLLLLISFTLSNAQTRWEKRYGGMFIDIAYGLDKCADGGFVLVGSSASSDGDITNHYGCSGSSGGCSDFWIVKTNASGLLQWQKSFGSWDNDTAKCVKQTSDGGYVIAGFSYFSGGGANVTNYKGGYDFWVLKINATGIIQWEKTFGGSFDDKASSIQQTSDGGYIVAGHTWSQDKDVSNNHGYSDFWVVKLTSSGSIEWTKTYGGASFEEASAIQQTTDGGYAIAGWTRSIDGDVNSANGNIGNFWLIKTNSVGLIQWEKTYPVPSPGVCNSMKQTSDGGYILAGYRANDYYVVKVNSLGTLVWSKSFGGSGNDKCYSVEQTTDNGYLLAGSSENSTKGNVYLPILYRDVWIVKLNSNGEQQWQKILGGSGTDIPYGVKQTNDGGYVVVGCTNSSPPNTAGDLDYLLIKRENCDLSITSQPINKSVHVGSSVSFQVSSSNVNAEYYWQRETTGGYEAIFEPSYFSGMYTPTLTLVNAQPYHGVKFRCIISTEDCSIATNEVTLTVLNGTGFKNEEDFIHNVSPNPTLDALSFNVSHELLGGNYIIYGTTGLTFLSGTIDNVHMNISLSSLPSGIYLLCAQTQKLPVNQVVKIYKY
jgi:hypothetical protein